MNNVAQSISCINTTLEECQTEHESTMVGAEGKICNQFVSIVIDLGASLSYVSPKVLENCKLVTKKYNTLG